MKIGLVLDDTLDTPDGVQQYVLGIGDWLSRHGHEVHYLVGQTERTDRMHIHSLSHNIHVTFNGNRLSIPLPASRKKIQSLLRAGQFDIIHVQVPYSPLLAGRVLRLISPRTAVIGTFHILPYSKGVVAANQVLALLNKRSRHRFDQMLAVSEPARDFARKTYGYEPMVLPNPLPLAQFSGVISSSHTLNIVFLGRLVARKGMLQLLRAVTYMRDYRLYEGEFRLIIGGKGPLLASLRSYVQRHKLEQVVSFSGFIAEAAKADFLSMADVAVFPSINGESFGISLLEAMACSRGVVVGGDNPGYRSVMQALGPGHLVDPSHTSDFAHQLAYWLASKDARKQASAMQKRYVRRFDIENIGEQLVRIYHQALQTRLQA